MFPPGTVIANRYEVIRLVGQGGMSNLYLCKDRKYQNALVVIKEMTAAYSDPKEQQMAVNLFHREAKLLASLNHRHIPKVYDYFQFQGKYYLSMEFVDGEDLGKKLMDKPGPMDEKDVAELGTQMATVLYYLHVHKPPIVFRDVKPSNIMMTAQGVKLIDFGIARHFDVAKKGDTMRIGSPGYAPPEQYSGQTDPRSDVYALGVTLHHAVTGRDPTTTNTPFILPPPRDLNPKCSQQMADIIKKATQLDPASRYQTMLEMKRDLAAIANPGAASGTRVVSGPPPTPKNRPGSTVPHSGPPPTTPAQNAQQPAQGSQSQTAAQPQTGPSQPQTQQPQQQKGQSNGQTQPKKKRFPVAAMLLLLCLAGGSVFITIKNPELTDRGAQLVYQLRQQLFANSVPSGPLEAANFLYQSGAPAAVCWHKLSQADAEKRNSAAARILAANLLAEMSQRPLMVVAALVPADDQATLAGLAAAQQLLNGAGGVDGRLLEVRWLPLDGDGPTRALRALSQGTTRVLGGQQPTAPELLLDFTGESTEDSGITILKVGGQELSRNSFPVLDPPLAALVEENVQGDLLWLLESSPPSGAQKASEVPAEFAAGTVVVGVAKAEAVLAKVKENPKLQALLVAEVKDDLPQAQERVSALVRFSALSPGRKAAQLAANYRQWNGSPSAAVAFDALCYAAHTLWTPGRVFRGATVVVNEEQARAATWAQFKAEKGQWVYQQQAEVNK